MKRDAIFLQISNHVLLVIKVSKKRPFTFFLLGKLLLLSIKAQSLVCNCVTHFPFRFVEFATQYPGFIGQNFISSLFPSFACLGAIALYLFIREFGHSVLFGHRRGISTQKSTFVFLYTVSVEYTSSYRWSPCVLLYFSKTDDGFSISSH